MRMGKKMHPMAFLRRHAKAGKRAVLVLLLICACLLLMLEFLSRGAAMIFNRAVANQDMLRGTITAEKILADPWGHVQFENLDWKDPDGDTILFVPSGSFQVRLWDILTKNFKATTLQEITLNDAEMSVHFTDDMKVDFIRPTPAMKHVDKDDDWMDKVSINGLNEEQRKRLGEMKRARRQQRFEKKWSNFNRGDRRIHTKLHLNNCKVEVFVKERHYLMDRVQLYADINTDCAMHIDASAGGFGGTMIGQGITLRGDIDFQSQELPVCDLSLALYEVDPSSLGFGLNIHDKMTLSTHFTGSLANPDGVGVLQMKELNIPALHFTNVTGDIFYKDPKLTFKNVHANVYGGTLDASGDYDLDTRYYHLKGHGTKLRTKDAFPKDHLSCLVDMDIEIDSKGSAKDTITSGTFESGKGHYRLLPFDRLAGRFTNAYKDLHFYDVAIDLAGVHIRTDAFRIQHGKLTLNPIQLFDARGNLMTTFRQDDIK